MNVCDIVCVHVYICVCVHVCVHYVLMDRCMCVCDSICMFVLLAFVYDDPCQTHSAHDALHSDYVNFTLQNLQRHIEASHMEQIFQSTEHMV